MRFSGIRALTDAVRTKKITCQEIVYRTMIAVEDHGPLNALVFADREGAIDRARKLDYRILKGEDVGPLCGVPVVVKDNIYVKDLPATAASAMLMDQVAPYSATAVERLEQAGAIIVAKSNMDELAMGSTSSTGILGPVRHPLDVTRSAGGSSGGSAVAVATGQCFAALGTDTGGSIRQPSALCGVVGLRPTYGAVSRHGLIAHAPSLDCIGPMTRTVADNAAILSVIAGKDPLDPTTASAQYGPTDLTDASVKGLRLGYFPSSFEDLPQGDVAVAMQDALALVERLGASLVPLTVPSLRYATAAYCVLSAAEAAEHLSVYGRSDSHEQEQLMRSMGFGYDVKRRILLGTYAREVDSGKRILDNARAVRTQLTRELDAALTQCDLIISPVSPTTAFPLDAKTDPMQAHLADVYVIPPALAGLPAISVPYAADRQGFPIGLQLIGRRGGEAELYRAAAAVEAHRRG